MQREEGVLVVSPWPYTVTRFEVEVDTYALHQLTFENEDALAEALREAPLTLRTWTVKQA